MEGDGGVEGPEAAKYKVEEETGRFHENMTVYVQYTYSIRTVYVTVHVKRTTVYVEFIYEESITKLLF